MHRSDSESQPQDEKVLSGRQPRNFEKDQLGDTHYQSMKWWHAAFVVIADTVSLGVLSLPSIMATLGLVPGVILIVGLGAVAGYSGYVLLQFKIAYPGVHSMADAGYILCGRFGQEVLGAAQVIFLLFGMGAHLLTFTIALNAISGHATCNIVWSVVGLAVLILGTLPRTLKRASYIGFASLLSIISAVLLTMVDLGVVSTPQRISATKPQQFVTAFGAVSTLIFAYAGHVTFFTVISELKTPRDFLKSLIFLQVFAVAIYVVAAVVIYVYVGDGVASPALGSLPGTPSRIAYGLALVTILGAGILDAHVAAKYIYVRLFRGTSHLTARSVRSIGTWVGIVCVLWVIAWVIAESIPNFNTLLGLMASLFSTWFTYGLSGVLWLHLNWGKRGYWWRGGWRKYVLAVVNVGLIAIGVTVTALGLWSNGLALHLQSTAGQTWSCGNKM